MKTIRNQLKYPIGLQLTMLLYKRVKNSWFSIFYAVTKRKTNRQQTKNQLKFARNCFGSHTSAHILWPPKYVRLRLRRTPTRFYLAAH